MPSSSPALTQSDPRLPLHARVKDDLLRRVRDQEWGSHTALPSETTLASDYGISVGTLRRVLSDLAQDGVLERRQGHGTFVRRASFHDSLYRFFRMDDSGEGVPDSRILARTRRSAPADVAQALAQDDNAEVLHLHRLRQWHDTTFLVEDIWLPLPQFSPLIEVDTDSFGPLLYPEFEQRLGIVVASATETLTCVNADGEYCPALDCPAGTPLIRIERIARTHAGDAVEYRVSHGLASTFRYQVEVR